MSPCASCVCERETERQTEKDRQRGILLICNYLFLATLCVHFVQSSVIFFIIYICFKFPMVAAVTTSYFNSFQCSIPSAPLSQFTTVASCCPCCRYYNKAFISILPWPFMTLYVIIMSPLFHLSASEASSVLTFHCNSYFFSACVYEYVCVCMCV